MPLSNSLLIIKMTDKMKKVFLALSVALATLVSCSNDDNQSVTETKEVSIDATSKTSWNYYSFSTGKLVGIGEESAEDNAEWFARTDWDIAINKYNVRTNSGAATTAGSTGGVYTCGSSVVFNSLEAVPTGTQFVADKAITSSGMGGDVTVVRSEATVILFKTNDDGSMIMPPVYLQAPVYVFRTAESKEYYKVQFAQYQDENKVSGHVKFYSAQIK